MAASSSEFRYCTSSIAISRARPPAFAVFAYAFEEVGEIEFEAAALSATPGAGSTTTLTPS